MNVLENTLPQKEINRLNQQIEVLTNTLGFKEQQIAALKRENEQLKRHLNPVEEAA